jgi:oxepin-CoA hydrolase/3-oxo-5,6-dehydrosuberyl-CoA semialdehyde dehydrogenase
VIRLSSYVQDQWAEGTGETAVLVNPSTEEAVAETTTNGIDMAAALAHARDVGGPALRAMTFAQRGELLKNMANALHEHREELLTVAELNNGGTRGDAKFDVDGATGTLASYARLGEKLGDQTFLVDGKVTRLSRARFVAHHVRMPRPGAAVHINAFNFPAWGTFEKVAVSILAGMPVVTKPATATAWLAWRMSQIIVEANILPAGAFTLICGSAGDLLDHLGAHDTLAFTGSADTAGLLRSKDAFTQGSTPVNIEADSLNAAVFGPKAEPGSDLWFVAVRNIVKDMTQKTGQKCTAVRRIIVPEEWADALCEAISEDLARIVVGNTADKNVTMGPVATANQLRDVRAGIDRLAAETTVVCGGSAPVTGEGAPSGKGYYVAPTLLRAPNADDAPLVHKHEVFGPCATVIPYNGEASEAARIVALGGGSLVSATYTDDRKWLGEFLMGAAPWNGRVLACTAKVADETLPPGMVLPNCLHGGPGRAGGGEELGGTRGLEFYMQRVAIQGDSGVLGKVLGISAE